MKTNKMYATGNFGRECWLLNKMCAFLSPGFTCLFSRPVFSCGPGIASQPMAFERCSVPLTNSRNLVI